MKKAIIILLLITTILALWTFDNSFIANTGGGSTSGTSAVIFAKADYVSVKATFHITPKAGTWANVTFSNGTQISIAWTNTFTVLFTKIGSETGVYAAKAPGGIFLNSKNPFDVAVVSNTTESYFDTLKSFNDDTVTVYWLKIDGDARVTVSGYGVAV